MQPADAQELLLEQWKSGDDCGVSVLLSAILSLATAAICSITTCSLGIAAGCVNGDIIFSSQQTARLIKTFCGPVADLQFFTPHVSAVPELRCDALSSLLGSASGVGPSPLRDTNLLALDSTGEVFIFGNLLSQEVRCCPIADKIEFVQNVVSLAGNSADATLEGKTDEDKDAALLRANKAGRPLSARKAGCAIGVSPQPLLWHDCGNGSEKKCQGNILSRGPTAAHVADFGGTGVNEIIISTMGRALVYCALCGDHPQQYVIRGVQTAPTQMFSIRVLRSESADEEDLLVLCGPRHVLVSHTGRSSISVEKLRSVAKLLQIPVDL
jgi:hypothetical protein